MTEVLPLMSDGEADFRELYYLESYLLNRVRPRLLAQGYLSAADFFCIVIWKANRAKSKLARKLLDSGYEDLDSAVGEMTAGIASKKRAKDKLWYLITQWRFRLPMASAILAVLYPDDFTVYDRRVCGQLDRFYNLASITRFERLWQGYRTFQLAVEEATPDGLSLRDKDRYLWGKSFYEQLIGDIEKGFGVK